MTSPAPFFAINPQLDVKSIADEFAARGRVRIGGFLSRESATFLHTMLRERSDWLQVLNSGEKLFELPRATRAAMTAAQSSALDETVYAGAREGFQYRYESIRVPDDATARRASTDPLAAFALWMSRPPTLDFLKAVTRQRQIRFADAQATAYAPGDFLTGHDDAFVGKNRHAAYVLGLTPVWREEWGGLLLFHQRAPDGIEGLCPRFNSLDVFRVPQLHSVSEVSRAAAYRRYSITGWLRGA